jgi:hypothetical protein
VSSRTEYSKGASPAAGADAQRAKGGGDSGANNGPTGSARSYPKGKGDTHNTNWNPMKLPASTYGVNGCG